MPAEPADWLRFAEDDLAASRRLISDRDLPRDLPASMLSRQPRRRSRQHSSRPAPRIPRTHDLIALAGLAPHAPRKRLESLELARLAQWRVAESRHRIR